MSEPSHSPSLTIDPAPDRWRERIDAAWRARAADPRAKRLREQLGVPTYGPVLMSGHQAEFWHAGILAKLLALASAATRTADASAAWVTVDQDSGDPWSLSVPTAKAERIELRLGPAPAPEVPTGGQPPVTPASDLEPRLAACQPATIAGVRRILAALTAHAKAPHAAAQVQRALADLTATLCPPPTWLLATSVARTDEFARIVKDIASDANACVARYNASAAANPGAGIRELPTSPRVEVPLWRLSPGRPRRRVFADELGTLPIGELAPRALLMTALLRRFACDLFIHGTGGGVYDRVTDGWIGEWRPDWTLAPTAVVTATRFIPFDGLAPVHTPAEIARAQWSAHRANHDPGFLRDPEAAAAKSRMVAEIAAAKARGERPNPAYRAMHEFLAGVRARHTGELASIAANAASLAAEAARSAVVFDRTWPFPICPPSVLDELKARIDSAFEASF